MSQGTLFYVIGASGAGKDSLLRYARRKIAGDSRVIFAHRYITRSAQLGGENHIEISEKEFHNRKNLGCFALSWNSHGLYYGIGIEINQWLSCGSHVVINGSRGYLNEASQRYPDNIVPILIKISPERLALRLSARGRETPEEIQQRLERAKAFNHIKHRRLKTLDNNDALEKAGDALITLITQTAIPS